ncbi:MAG: membrane integrity-associated transporter subunit PqiC [Desulfobacterales bacterium]|nr:membrane integrity-associated transporter subunit PqiC [Desulfobacterales bacterium]MBF0396272.1 membrane integrity-associated transporter subunit PqiC [Desulfobacterales bacterium]
MSFKQPSIKNDYYTLEYDPPNFKDLSPLPYILQVDRFEVSPLYNTTNIVYREDGFKRDIYNYHKWRANPSDLVTYFLARDLRECGIFKAAFSLSNRAVSTHIIKGSVDEFFEYDKSSGWEAVLGLNITLCSENEPDISKSIIFQKRYSTREIFNEKNPQALASSMSKAMSKLSKLIILDIYNSISKAK